MGTRLELTALKSVKIVLHIGEETVELWADEADVRRGGEDVLTDGMLTGLPPGEYFVPTHWEVDARGLKPLPAYLALAELWESALRDPKVMQHIIDQRMWEQEWFQYADQSINWDAAMRFANAAAEAMGAVYGDVDQAEGDRATPADDGPGTPKG